jgi:hypothetical protein
MKWFYATCGALVVGMLLVGSVHAGHAGSRHSGPRAGHHSGPRTGLRLSQHSGHNWRAFRPWPRQFRWQWLPQRPGGNDLNPGGDDLIPGGDDANSGTYDSGPEGPDPNSGGPQPGTDSSDGDVPQTTVTPTGGNQRRLPELTNRSPRAPRSQPLRR